MGCATSVLPLNKANGHFGQPTGASIENEQELAALTAPPPKIQLSIGNGLKKFQEFGHNIIFVFGGPFSMKGLLVEEMVSAFNFTVITTEDIVLSYLPNKVANTVQTTQEIKDLLQTDPSMLNLEWVLNLVAARLTTNSQRLFIIDVVPNMHTILRLENFNKPDIRKEMTDFERRFPVMLALNLVVTEDKLSSAYVSPGIAMKLNKTSDKGNASSSSEDESDAPSKEKGKDGKDDKNKSLFSEGSDEMDSSRMKRRHDLYQSCADPFITYFEETHRVVTIHVAPLQKEFVWKRMLEFFREIGYPCKQAGRTVLLFAFNEEQIEGLDTLYYKMLKVSLSAIVSNKNENMENMIRAVARYVKRSASSASNHLIILDCLNTRMDSEIPRKINFLEIKEYYLDQFIRIKSTTIKGKPFRRRFKAISTTSNEVCLFPTDGPDDSTPSNAPNADNTELCKKIAFCYLTADQPTTMENGKGIRRGSRFVESDPVETLSSTDNDELNRSVSNHTASVMSELT